jgi:hypothetical protein
MVGAEPRKRCTALSAAHLERRGEDFLLELHFGDQSPIRNWQKAQSRSVSGERELKASGTRPLARHSYSAVNAPRSVRTDTPDHETAFMALSAPSVLASATTSVPPPEIDCIESVPPNIRRRSCMVARPSPCM